MRKPIALLAAGSMMLMPLLGATSVVLTPVSEAYAEAPQATIRKVSQPIWTVHG